MATYLFLENLLNYAVLFTVDTPLLFPSMLCTWLEMERKY